MGYKRGVDLFSIPCLTGVEGGAVTNEVVKSSPEKEIQINENDVWLERSKCY